MDNIIKYSDSFKLTGDETKNFMELLCENRAELFHDTNEVSYIIKRAASNIDYDSIIFVNTDTPCEIILMEHNVDDNTRSSAMKVKVTSESHLGNIRRKSFNNSFRNAKYYSKLLSGAKVCGTLYNSFSDRAKAQYYSHL